MRSAVLTVALASIFLCAAAAGAQASETVDRVVRVRAIGIDGKVNVGSGVIVGPERIATACHVTRRSATITVTHGAQRWEAAEEIGSESHDLCVLRVLMTDLPNIRTRDSEDLRLGDAVTAVGFEVAGGEALVRHGVIAGLYRYDGGYVIRTTASFDFGSSGGGLFDEAGNLIGILAFKARNGDNLRFALPADWITAGNAVAESFVPVSSQSTTSTFWERSQCDRPQFLGVAMREAANERN